jgi:DDE superfamily endonuclease
MWAANEPVVLVFDNVGYHKSHALRAVWQRYADRLEPFSLPAYASHLNLIEHLWRYIKQKLAAIAGGTILTASSRRPKRSWPASRFTSMLTMDPPSDQPTTSAKSAQKRTLQNNHFPHYLYVGYWGERLPHWYPLSKQLVTSRN